MKEMEWCMPVRSVTLSRVQDDGDGTMGEDDDDDDDDDGDATGDGAAGYDDDNYGWHYWGNGDGERDDRGHN